MEVIKGLKTKSQIYFSADLYAFIKNNARGNKVYLQCKSRCGVTRVLNTSNNTFTQKKLHSHPPDLLLREKLQFREFLKRKAASTNDKIQDIFLEGQRRFPEAAKTTGGLVQYRSMIFRARGKRFVGGQPTDLEGLHASLQLEGNER